MNLDPRISFWLNIVVALAGFLAASSTQVSELFGPNVANIMAKSSALLVGFVGAINAVLHALPAPGQPMKSMMPFNKK